MLWVTSIAAPYRYPVYEALANDLDLRVLLLESPEELRAVGARGEDWILKESPTTYRMSYARSIALTRGYAPLYTLLPGALRGLKGVDVAVINGWDGPAYWQTLMFAKLRRIRTVGFYESTGVSSRINRGPLSHARRRFFRQLDAVVTPGAAASASVREMGVPEDVIFEGFNAVDVRAFHEAGMAEGDGNVQQNPGHRYIFVGQLIPRKNVGTLLMAAKSALQQSDTLTIVGGGPQRNELENAIAGLGLSSQVMIHDAVPSSEVASWLSRHHTLVLPSEEEVWGLVVNEALAAGAHVVVSDRCGVAASVSSMRGVFVSGTDVFSVAEAMTLSRAAWTGRVVAPEILRHTPEAFANVFLSAIKGPGTDTAAV